MDDKLGGRGMSVGVGARVFIDCTFAMSRDLHCRITISRDEWDVVMVLLVHRLPNFHRAIRS